MIKVGDRVKLTIRSDEWPYVKAVVGTVRSIRGDYAMIDVKELKGPARRKVWELKAA